MIRSRLIVILATTLHKTFWALL